jgi:hypothetical protein
LIIVKPPYVRYRPIQLEKVPQTAAIPPANQAILDVVAAPPDSFTHTADAVLGRWQPEVN